MATLDLDIEEAPVSLEEERYNLAKDSLETLGRLEPATAGRYMQTIGIRGDPRSNHGHPFCTYLTLDGIRGTQFDGKQILVPDPQAPGGHRKLDIPAQLHVLHAMIMDNQFPGIHSNG